MGDTIRPGPIITPLMMLYGHRMKSRFTENRPQKPLSVYLNDILYLNGIENECKMKSLKLKLVNVEYYLHLIGLYVYKEEIEPCIILGVF